MAPVAAWVATAVASLFSSAVLAAVVYTAVYYVALAAIMYGVGRMMSPRALGGLGSALTSGSPLQMTRDPVPPRRVIYGRTRVSGPLRYWETTGTNNMYLHLVVAHAGHEVEEMGDMYFNDVVVPLDGSGNATGTYAGFARIKKHLGSDSQTADTDLVSESSGFWTTNHRLRGIAYSYTKIKADQSKFPGGFPNIGTVIKGRKVYDPRTSTTAWSDNPALCIRDYLTNATFGLAADASEIDEASFIAAANICDEVISLPGSTTEKRYTVNGCFDLDASPDTVLEKLCGSMAGWVVFVGGLWICHAGAHQTPTITLDENDLRAGIDVQTKASMRDTCNGVKGTFASEAEAWQPADFPAVQSATALAEDGGEIWRDMDYPFTTSAWTAQRLATIELNCTRQDMMVNFPGKLTCLRVQGGDTVMVNNTRWGWSSKIWLVAGLKFSVYDANGSPAIGVDLKLRETAAELWEGAQVLEYDPAPNTNLGTNLWVGIPGADGKDGNSVFIEYSIDGTTSWHSTYTLGDLYQRVKLGTSGTWSDGMPTISPLNLLTDPSNLAFNPNFSAGPVGWYLYAGEWTIATAYGENGEWGAHQNVGHITALRNNLGIRCKSGDRFHLAGKIKGLTCTIRVQVYDKDDNEIYGGFTPFGSSNSAWSLVEELVSIPIGAVWCRAEFVGSDTYCAVASVTLTRIPANVDYTEPSQQVPPPGFSVDPGAGQVTLANNDPAATLKYSINGGSPATYSGPISVSSGDVVRSWAERSGLGNSYNNKILMP
jgi:hypothetical protein